MSLNTILIIVLLITAGGIVLFMYHKSRTEKADIEMRDVLTMNRLLERVKYALADLVREETFSGLDDEEWEALYKRKARIQEAMKNCVYGIDSAKLIVKDLITTVIKEEVPDEKAALQLVDFHSTYMDPRVKFEILMLFMKREHGRDAFVHMITKYDLDRERFEIEDKKQPSYMITPDDINYIYVNEDIRLNYEDMIEVLTVLIYQRYKGFGHVDTILEMNINGINIGASGSVLQSVNNTKIKMNRAPRSCWLNLWGKYLHLRFINFGNEEEVRRVVQLICRYNSPGPLTEKRGYLVNTMHDKSRVLAMRPPVAEYWAVFVRKFSISNATTNKLVIKKLDRTLKWSPEYEAKIRALPGIKEDWIEELKISIKKNEPTIALMDSMVENGMSYPGFTANARLPMKLYYYLMRGQVTVAFTGRQNSGKTTMMSTVVYYMDPRYTIRVLEMAPELYLREMYPDRNILSVQETEWVTAQALQDALKKSDAAISIVGEVATDIVAARMIQMGQIASLFTIFSHHANTGKDLVYGLRNSLVNASGMTPNTAEDQVLDVVKVNSHLDFDTSGKRFIERFTEIITLDTKSPYPEIDINNIEYAKAMIDREYYTRVTDREKFTTRDVLKYDHDIDGYVTLDWFTPKLTKHMLDRMPRDLVPGFKEFIKTEWAKSLNLDEGDVAV